MIAKHPKINYFANMTLPDQPGQRLSVRMSELYNLNRGHLGNTSQHSPESFSNTMVNKIVAESERRK